MEVMNGGDYEQKNVLVGQAGKTQGFGVTNDPILMGMLSTGLYGNPLRTMTQEVLFNAWDAHRMGNCQDKPIDVYINDTSGLIIRDYGPGISPDEIHPIYCIYGNSTKRKDASLTGGFGLGSKSPYAYTDSFTVTSHHGKQKSMYMMNRVSEENNGGPGMTPIIQGIPTEETGLMVTIPMKSERDMLQTYEYIKDILFLSGIKANIHYKDGDPELIESDSVNPTEWFIDSESKSGRLYAVYGGVRYAIPDNPAYHDEWRFNYKLAKIIGDMHIGFKPSSLTPLPNREGLNLNEQTVAAIKTQLEMMEESFQQILIPILRTTLNETMKELAQTDIQPMFLAMKWTENRTDSMTKFVYDSQKLLKSVLQACPPNTNVSAWNSLAKVAVDQTRYLVEIIDLTKFDMMKYATWAKYFPKYTHYKPYMLQIAGRKEVWEHDRPLTYAKLIQAQKNVANLIGTEPEIRISGYNNEGFLPVVNIRNAGKISKGIPYRKEALVKKLGDKLKTPSQPYPDRLWYKKDGDEVEQVLMHNVIIIAQTISALKDTHWKWQGIFSPKYANVNYHHPYHIDTHCTSYRYRSNKTIVPAIIVHNKKGAYEQARDLLKKMGYDVLEAELPTKRERKPKIIQADGTLTIEPEKKTITYPLYNRQKDLWQDEILTEEPTCWMKVTASEIKGYHPPEREICSYVNKRTERLVVINSDARISRLEKMGIPSIQEKFKELITELLESPDLNTMMLHHHVYQEANIPEEIIRIPEVSKFLGLPYIRTSKLPQFIEDYSILKFIKDNGRSGYGHILERPLYLQVNHKLNEGISDPSFSLVRERCKKLNFFDKKHVMEFTNGMKPHELKTFSEKFLRFLRTV